MDGGIVKGIIAGAVFIIASFNLINGIFRNFETIDILFLTIPLYLISIALFLFNVKFLLFLSLLIIGSLTTSLNDDINNYSGAIFFALSYFIYDRKCHLITISILTAVTISIKSNINNMEFNTTFNFMLAYIVVYLVFYFVIYRKIKKLEKRLKEKRESKLIIRNIDVINISEEDKAILKLYCRGYDYDKISRTLGLNVVPKTVRRKITSVMKEYKLNNDAHFGQWLFQKV